MTRQEDVWQCHAPETIGSIEEDGTINKEYTGNGYVYKNYQAFHNKSEEVCYVSELDDDFMGDSVGWRYRGFWELAKDFIETNEDVKEYCSNNNITAHDMAVRIFESVDWQDPATLVDEWEQNSTFTE